jgi:hypothetical protein
MRKGFKRKSNKKISSSPRESPSQGDRMRRPPSKTEEFTSTELDLPPLGTGPTTRKTIEVPEDFFYRVKRRALDRRMKEKELWAEILYEYFSAHPTN